MDVRNTDRNSRARLRPWPHEPDIAHLVLLDHNMVPEPRDVIAWSQAARASGARSIRTGALFEDSVPAFVDAGFQPIDRLALLELDLLEFDWPAAPPIEQRQTDRGPSGTKAFGTKALRWHRFGEAAQLDRRAFVPPWGNDRAALVHVMHATPSHRARAVFSHGRIAGFALSGMASTTGYLQRLAVEPATQRRGLGRSLALDALAWMRRGGVGRVYVNTAVDNAAALALYTALGFRRRDDTLVILELELTSR